MSEQRQHVILVQSCVCKYDFISVDHQVSSDKLNTNEVRYIKKLQRMIVKIMKLSMILLLLLVKLSSGRRASHFSKPVNVEVIPGDEDSELKMFIGTLEILLIKRDDLLQSLVTRNVGGVVMGHLSGSLFSGVVSEKQDCNVRMWIRDMKLMSGNIDCKRKHFVIEQLQHGGYMMHKELFQIFNTLMFVEGSPCLCRYLES